MSSCCCQDLSTKRLSSDAVITQFLLNVYRGRCVVCRGPGSNISRSTPISPIPPSTRCPKGIQENSFLYFIPILSSYPLVFLHSYLLKSYLVTSKTSGFLHVVSPILLTGRLGTENKVRTRVTSLGQTRKKPQQERSNRLEIWRTTFTFRQKRFSFKCFGLYCEITLHSKDYLWIPEAVYVPFYPTATVAAQLTIWNWSKTIRTAIQNAFDSQDISVFFIQSL